MLKILKNIVAMFGEHGPDDDTHSGSDSTINQAESDSDDDSDLIDVRAMLGGGIEIARTPGLYWPGRGVREIGIRVGNDVYVTAATGIGLERIYRELTRQADAAMGIISDAEYGFVRRTRSHPVAYTHFRGQRVLQESMAPAINAWPARRYGVLGNVGAPSGGPRFAAFIPRHNNGVEFGRLLSAFLPNGADVHCVLICDTTGTFDFSRVHG